MELNYNIRRESHAIGEFSATLKFAAPVGPSAFTRVLARLSECAQKLDLPAPMNIQVLNFAVGGPMMPPHAAPFALSGNGFQRFLPNGEIASSLRCDQDSIVITIREYERWHTVLPQIVDTFGVIGEEYLPEVPAIISFSVQYLNEFKAKTPEVVEASEIFKAESRWVAKFGPTSDQPWHCHVGRFIPGDSSYRYLVNVNCDIVHTPAPGDAQAHNYARILILAVRNYDLPDVGPLVISVENFRAELERNYNDIHSLEKRILGEVISDDYLAIMGDGANEH
jgi:hypothetical protein